MSLYVSFALTPVRSGDWRLASSKPKEKPNLRSRIALHHGGANTEIIDTRNDICSDLSWPIKEGMMDKQEDFWRLSLQSTKIPMLSYKECTTISGSHRTSDIHQSCMRIHVFPHMQSWHTPTLILSGPLSPPHQQATVPAPQGQAP